MIVDVEHPEYGPITLPGSPMHVSNGGEINTEVYKEFFDYDEAKLQELQDVGVI